MSSPDERRASSKRTAEMAVAERMQEMARKGRRISVIAEAVRMPEDQVIQALVADGTSKALMDRLLNYPDYLCCPIHLSLMEDPVVAEDGNSREGGCLEIVTGYGCAGSPANFETNA